ncbi:LD-carboxypeptidase [Mollicutes bacterium LVI A0078]|nr:LD-carboxypeptidase [Mollicutes bacterium LVI A0075]WOO91194.1 LD-carboxypeptidase [Mollicutes bacterium LVI A0078]
MNIDIIVTSNNSQDFNNQLLETKLEEHTFNVSALCYQAKSTDDDKVSNIKTSLNNDSEVIVAMRGGSGLTRLMAALKAIEISSSPKTFVGYSDLTALINWLPTVSNIKTIHGPMAFELTSESRIAKFANALSNTNVIFDKPATWLVKGNLSGQVVGGNMMLVTDSLGTFYEPDFNNKLLLLEEVDEPIDKLDRMFAQLRDTGVLNQVQGILLGNFKNCATDIELQTLFETYLVPLDIPVLYNLNLGHIDDSDYISLYTDLCIDENGIYYKD